jgi:hypothetical protein
MYGMYTNGRQLHANIYIYDIYIYLFMSVFIYLLMFKTICVYQMIVNIYHVYDDLYTHLEPT